MPAGGSSFWGSRNQLRAGGVRWKVRAAVEPNALNPTPAAADTRKPRVVIGMSGGVDSSVAAYLLKQQGYDVVGVTMKVWPQDCISRAEDKCCGPQAIADARGVAHALGIPHYVVDEAVSFERTVIDYFTAEYQNGRTPNPCVMCNEKVKFGNLWAKAKSVGAEYIATGHYAIVEHHADRAVLRRGGKIRARTSRISCSACGRRSCSARSSRSAGWRRRRSAPSPASSG